MPSVEIHRVRSRAEHVERTLRILAPESSEPLPVLYLHDGQNVFDQATEVSSTWGVDAAMDAWIAGGGAPWIVVAIDHRGVERIADDSPWKEPSAHTRAHGAAYARFVADEATAFVDQHFRTTNERALVGSSLGGLMALYIAAKHPHVFGRIGAFSPTTMWAGDRLSDLWTSHTPRPHRTYIDVGEHEYFENEDTVLDYGRDVPRFVAHLRELGFDEDGLRFVIDPEGEHREADWRRRFVEAMPFLLG